MKRKIPLVRCDRFSIDCLRPELTMKVLTTFGFRTMRFVLDTGSDITTISRATADDMRIPFDTQLRRVAVNGMGGRTHGVLTELVVRLFGMERTIPCVIADSAPNTRESRSE